MIYGEFKHKLKFKDHCYNLSLNLALVPLSNENCKVAIFVITTKIKLNIWQCRRIHMKVSVGQIGNTISVIWVTV